MWPPTIIGALREYAFPRLTFVCEMEDGNQMSNTSSTGTGEDTSQTSSTSARTSNLELRTSDGERFKTFHNKGRWQGQPLRVEETGALPAFEQVVPPDVASDAPDVLMFGVPNYGMMAGQPTNVFLLGYVNEPERKLTLVDAGATDAWSDLEAAFENSGIPLSRIGQIILTHTHPDHIGNAQAIKAATGAPVWAHPREQQQIERFGNGIEIDHWVEGDETIACDGFSVQTIFTPGHSPGHYCVVEPLSRILIAGDMISGFGSVGVFPPNGSMRDYIDSLRRLQDAYATTAFSLACPGHGPVIPDARAKIAQYIEHRLQREDDVAAAVASGANTVDDLMPIIYPDVQPHLAWPARSTLQTHLDKLVEDGRLEQPSDEHYAVASLSR
jgi:glyoxylase-like metal-dependent hydrolase (beta-lactamase superfamily II)